MPARSGRRGLSWQPPPADAQARDLHSSTVGLVELSATGAALARRLQGFGCSLLYCGEAEPARAAAVGARHVSFEELLAVVRPRARAHAPSASAPSFSRRALLVGGVCRAHCRTKQFRPRV